MKKLGCYRVAIGIESANNEILKRIAKNETIEQIDSLEKSINYALKSKLDKAAFYVLFGMLKDIIPEQLYPIVKRLFSVGVLKK